MPGTWLKPYEGKGALRGFLVSRVVFTLHHVMRVGHLADGLAQFALSFARQAPAAWGVTHLPLPMPHDLPSAELCSQSTQVRCTHPSQGGLSLGRRYPVEVIPPVGASSATPDAAVR